MSQWWWDKNFPLRTSTQSHLQAFAKCTPVYDTVVANITLKKKKRLNKSLRVTLTLVAPHKSNRKYLHQSLEPPKNYDKISKSATVRWKQKHSNTVGPVGKKYITWHMCSTGQRENTLRRGFGNTCTHTHIASCIQSHGQVHAQTCQCSELKFSLQRTNLQCWQVMSSLCLNL